MQILITGSAGFIGFNLAKYLLEKTNVRIIGIDSLNNYYSKNTINYFNTYFLDYCNSLCRSSDVTVGFCATILACSLSKNVSVYGFNFFKENDWSKKHYFEKITPYKQGHNFKYEEEYFNELKNKKFIKIK